MKKLQRAMRICALAFGPLALFTASAEATESAFSRFILQTGTPLGQGEDANGDFTMADVDHDGIADLVFIKRRNTGTNSIEVHILSGASRYQRFSKHTGTPLTQGEDANGSFTMADVDHDGIADLVFIKRRNTGTNSIEVHILSGASSYQKFIKHTGSSLVQDEDINGDFLMADADQNGSIELVFIKRRNTETNTIEFHALAP